jgi:hypothetical protein
MFKHRYSIKDFSYTAPPLPHGKQGKIFLGKKGLGVNIIFNNILCRYIFILYAQCGLVENGEPKLQIPRILYALQIGSMTTFTYCIYPIAAIWNDYIFFSTGITGRLCLGLMICHKINFKKVFIINIALTCVPVFWSYLLRLKVYVFLSKMVRTHLLLIFIYLLV